MSTDDASEDTRGAGADLLGTLLEGMLGGTSGSQAAPGGAMPQGSEDALGSLLEGMLGGASGSQAAPGGATPQGSSDALGGLLEGLLGGAAGSQAAPGAATSQGGGLMDILGAVLGGGGANQLGGNPMLAPFTEALSDKLNISPQMASVLIGAAFTLLAGMMKKGSEGGQRLPEGADLDSLLDEDYITRSGVASQVAEQTGLDEETAAHHLSAAMAMLANQPAAAAPVSAEPKPSKPSELDSLLDSWDVDA